MSEEARSDTRQRAADALTGPRILSGFFGAPVRAAEGANMLSLFCHMSMTTNTLPFTFVESCRMPVRRAGSELLAPTSMLE